MRLVLTEIYCLITHEQYNVLSPLALQVDILIVFKDTHQI